MNEIIWTLLILPFGLGLLGFVEPCSIGSSLLFLKTIEEQPARRKFAQAAIFTVTRAAFVGLLGAVATLVGSAFTEFQEGAWVLLGLLYVAFGAIYLSGRAGLLMRRLGPAIERLSTIKGAAGLGFLLGLNIPACAAPLLTVLLGTAALGAESAVRGFVMLGVFGLALSLPIAAAVSWAPARRALDRIAALSKNLPLLIGGVFVALGAWSIYFGVGGG